MPVVHDYIRYGGSAIKCREEKLIILSDENIFVVIQMIFRCKLAKHWEWHKRKKIEVRILHGVYLFHHPLCGDLAMLAIR